VGAGARMKLVVNMVMGTMMGAFSEGMALADQAGLTQADLLEVRFVTEPLESKCAVGACAQRERNKRPTQVLSLGAIANPMFALKGPSMTKREFPPAFPLKHQQKDLRLALELGHQVGLPLPVATAADGVYRQAMAAGCADNDFAAVYTATLPPP
jgi:glyoxylate/succinic semialdehyde reductase